MSENIRGWEENKKDDGECYFLCKRCWSTHPIRVLITTTYKHYRRNKNIDKGPNEY